MSIKSTTSTPPCSKKELPYPKLMKGTYTGNIYIMSCVEKGIILEQGPKCNSKQVVGTLVQGQSAHNFRDYKGSVCLENEKG